jgi:hypothetical protein
VLSPARLTTQIFIGLLLGIVVGYLWPAFGVAIKPLADAFLRMIKMIIAPLVFSTLVVGIAGTGDLKAMGRIGVKALVYFESRRRSRSSRPGAGEHLQTRRGPGDAHRGGHDGRGR